MDGHKHSTQIERLEGRRDGPAGALVRRREAQDRSGEHADSACNIIDSELFEIERAINGQSPERRRAVRQELSAPLVANLEAWMREQRAKLARGNDVAKAMDYMLKRWIAFTRFLDDRRICLSNNAAERGVRGIALGKKILVVLRLRSWRRAGRYYVQLDRHG
jgi:hypothetical protein